MCAPLGREKALQNGAFAHKPLHPSKALTEPARLLLHNPATHTGLLSAQQEATELPQTTIIPRNHLEMHLVALSAPRLEPDPPFLLHPAQSSFLYPCLSNTKKKSFPKKPASSENKAFLTIPQSYRAPARGLPPVKTSREPSTRQLPSASHQQVLPLALALACHSEKPGEEEDLLAPVGPIPVQQVCSPIPHCYCSHATPCRHIGARPETITISYNNVRAAPEPSQCRKTPCSFIL